MRKETSLIGEDIRKLAYRVERYLRLEATERLTVLTTVIVLAALSYLFSWLLTLAVTGSYILYLGSRSFVNLKRIVQRREFYSRAGRYYFKE